MESYREATSVDAVHAWLAEGTGIRGKQVMLVDIRGHVTYQKSHIKSSLNLRLSTLLMRRIFRGTAAVENVCPGTIRMDIERRKQYDVCVVLYDESSTKQNIHKDVHLYAEMLQPSTANPILYIDGKEVILMCGMCMLGETCGCSSVLQYFGNCHLGC